MKSNKKCPICGTNLVRLYFKHSNHLIIWGFMCYGCGLVWNEEIKNPSRLVNLAIEEETKKYQ